MACIDAPGRAEPIPCGADCAANAESNELSATRVPFRWWPVWAVLCAWCASASTTVAPLPAAIRGVAPSDDLAYLAFPASTMASAELHFSGDAVPTGGGVFRAGKMDWHDRLNSGFPVIIDEPLSCRFVR